MRRFLILLATAWSSLPTYGQGSGSIQGSVTDGESRALSLVSVSLLKAEDSSLAKLAITDKEGHYQFEHIKGGSYLVIANLVGYKKGYSKAFTVNSAGAEVPVILLTPAPKTMQGVVVQARRPLIETRADKTIVNVDASPSNAGATALDVLEKSPGVSVDDNGNISLKGKQGVIIMMDGKLTYLSSADLAEMLKNVPASALDQIEIMTNPSAKYDASGNSGIINIRTKKGKNNGFNGSIMAGISSSIFSPEGLTYLIPKSQNSININYRHNKINLFASFNPNIFNGRNYQTIHRTFLDGSGKPLSYADQVVRSKYGNHNEMLKVGLDWYANKKNVYGIVLSGFSFQGHPTPQTTSILSDANHQAESVMVSLTKNKRNFRNLTSNFNWKHSFDTAGKELTADIDYVHYNNTVNQLLTTDFYDPSGQASGPSLYLQGVIPSLIDIYSVKSDLTLPFKGGHFDAGVKSSYVRNNNVVDYSRQLVDKSWVPDSRSNHFLYNENINAAYVNASKQIRKWTVQAGLRLENTVAKGYQFTNDSTFRRNYTNLFPTAFASYAVTAKDVISFSYGRRIMRPNYRDLNPFTYFLDSLTYYVGNPYLLPQYSHNLELSYSLRNKYILTLNYNITKDVIAEVLKQNSEKMITYNTPENVSRLINSGIALTIPISISKWWTVNLFSNLYNNHYTGLYNGYPVDASYTAVMANVSNTFIVSRTFSAELSGFYRTRNVDELFIVDPVGQMSVAFQKQVVKGKGTVRLNIRDPFAWQRYSGYSKLGGIDLRESNYFDVRQVTLNFTYRFGKNQQGQQRRHSGGSQDEQNRVGAGGN